ncbi:MAG: ParA family protein [Gammaproteobacteria bacterium]
MSQVIVFANQKGGVGKTTSCINLAASLQAAKRRVLLIDFDPQGNATMGSGVEKYNLAQTVNDVLLEQCTLAAIIKPTHAGYDIAPANADLTEAEIVLARRENSQYQLKQAIQTITTCYDFIVVDCPPSLNMLTLNALVAADSILIPVQCEYFALEGLASLLETIEQVKATSNPELKIEGVLRTMYDGRSRLVQDVSAQLSQHFGELLYHTVIPRNIRLAEAPSHGLPALHYDKQSPGALAYLALAGEILRKQAVLAEAAVAEDYV